MNVLPGRFKGKQPSATEIEDPVEVLKGPSRRKERELADSRARRERKNRHQRGREVSVRCSLDPEARNLSAFPRSVVLRRRFDIRFPFHEIWMRIPLSNERGRQPRGEQARASRPANNYFSVRGASSFRNQDSEHPID